MQSSNLNINPYFDDFDENKNFHKVLYKPGTVVQARELTQSQTILQEQVKRIGDYLFKDGSTVTGLESGAIILDNKVRTIFLKIAFDCYISQSILRSDMPLGPVGLYSELLIRLSYHIHLAYGRS